MDISRIGLRIFTIVIVAGSSAWLDSSVVSVPCCLPYAVSRVDRDVERVVVSSSANELKTWTTVRCAEAGALRGVLMILLVFFS